MARNPESQPDLDKSFMKSKTNVPTAGEFAQASQFMTERARGLDEVRAQVLRHFRDRCPLQDCFILDQSDANFRAYVFFERDVDIEANQRAGVQNELVDFIYRCLEQVGRGKRAQIAVAFEFDSHENVKARFAGNYRNRLL